MFTLKSILFKKFGSYEKKTDTYKDVNGEGINERYNNSLAEDFDENILPKINEMPANLLDTRTVFERFLFYISSQIGVQEQLFPDLYRQRKYTILFNSLLRIKSTIKAYQVMFNWLGFEDSYIIEHWQEGGFDSPFTFDSTKRKFDSSGCSSICREYSIQLVGNVVNNPSLIDQIFKVIEFNEPIYAKLRSLSINGNYAVREVISVYISDGTDGNEAGDLIYNNDYDPELILRIADSTDYPTYLPGDLIISGPNSDKYYVNSNGDLIYSTSDFYFNNAIKLKSSNSEYISYPHSSIYNLSGGKLSIGFWIKLDSNSKEVILSKIDSNNGYEIYVESGSLFVRTLSSQDENIISSSETINDNSWHFVFIEIDTENANNYNVYVDSVLSGKNVIENNSLDSNIDNSTAILIGRSGSEYGNFTIDNLFISNQNINQNQLDDYYNNGEGNDEETSSIITLLRSNFDEILGTVIFDQSSNLNHGQLNNAVGNTNQRIPH